MKYPRGSTAPGGIMAPLYRPACTEACLTLGGKAGVEGTPLTGSPSFLPLFFPCVCQIGSTPARLGVPKGGYCWAHTSYAVSWPADIRAMGATPDPQQEDTGHTVA